jgi:hypothetical protein
MMTQDLAGRTQNIPQPDANGTVDCQWVESYSLNIPTNWVSGIYLVKLIAGNSRVESLLSFVVRDDARTSDFVLASTFNTSQAYNNWGGKSLYEFNSLNSARATAISFNRPDVDGGGCGQVMHWELSMIRFMEREGYDIKYIANNDVHVNGSGLLKSKAFLSVGHDEYWTYEMKQAVMNAQAAGVSTAFMSANACYWQVRMNGRIMTSYKENADQDPFVNGDRKRITTRWRDLAPLYGVNDPVAKAENGLSGVMYHGDPVNGDLIVYDPNHWIYAGTGVVAGTRFTGLLGYETDAMFNNGLAPAGVQKIMESPDPHGYSHATVATLPSGAITFGAGTMQWSWGVDFCPSWAPNSGEDRSNAAFQQINRNLLNRMKIGGQPPPPPVITPQTISFALLVAPKVGDPPFTISASASSGLPVSFKSLTPTIASVNGNVVTILKAGNATIVANQAGNTQFSAAPQVTQSFAVSAPITGGGPVLAPTGLTGYSCNTGCWAYGSQGGPANRINWTQSKSPNIVKNGIYRSLEGGTKTLIATMPAGTTYIDRNVVLNTTYHYSVTAIDVNNNVSPLSSDTAFAFLP